MNYRRMAALAALFAILICLIATAAAGQELKLVGPKEADVNRPFEVSVEGLLLPLSAFQTSPPQITWLTLGADAQVRQRMELVVSMVGGKPVWMASPYVTVTAGKAEKLYVVLTVDRAGEFAQQASLEVTCGPPTPPPSPGKRWVILIEESSERTAAMAWVMTSSIIRDYLVSKGHAWRAWDKDHVPADGVPYFRACEGKTPILFIVTAGGSILYRGPPPLDPESFVALVKQYGG